MPASSDTPWLILIHQLPLKPPYLRVKVWRRLQALGAIPIRNSVYVLPNTDSAREDFEWTLREIQKERGEASLYEARIVDGLTDDEVQASFRTTRDADYQSLATEIRTFVQATLRPRSRSMTPETERELEGALARFRKRFGEIAAIDFFGAPRRETVEGLIAGLEERLVKPGDVPELNGWRIQDVQKRVWVTRHGVHIDRIACAWLIQRFIDPSATFKFVSPKGYAPTAREIRFDMFKAEFTHHGELCSFEVLLRAFALEDPALHAVGEVVHDIDLKDTKYGRAETTGIDHLIAGLAWTQPDDTARRAHGAALFDALYGYFKRRKG
jgi:hypothetical protein